MPNNYNHIFLPIHAGKALSSQELNIQADNELNGQPCDNISSKNDSLCELTAIYWAWKNLKNLCPDVKYIGLYHYRRFLAFDESKSFTNTILKNESDIIGYKIDPAEIISILEKGYTITVHKSFRPYPIYIDYSILHISEDYRTLKKVIDEKFHDYFPDFLELMEHNNKYCAFNIFIMKWEDFEKYCEWLFAVVSELEPLIPFQHYNAYQKRALAFMTERLLQIWLVKNKKRTMSRNAYYYDGNSAKKDSKPVTFIKWLCRFAMYMKVELIFNLMDFSFSKKFLKPFRQ